MTTRRSFLTTVTGGLSLAALGRARAAGGKMAPVGLQLYSVRKHLDKDVPGSLAKVKALGFDDVETAGFHGLTAEGFAAALKKAGLVCRSGHFPFERFRDDVAGVLGDARTLGAKFVACAWIPHEGRFNRDHTMKAAEVFTSAGKAAKEKGLRFAYHIHGYEFETSPEGTLFDTLVKNTPPDLVAFEIDVLWAKAGGADPAALIQKHAGRVPLTHLKDMAKGTPHGKPASQVPETANVALGTGLIDFPAILRASARAGVEHHFLEDESPRVLEQLAESVAYLKRQAAAV